MPINHEHRMKMFMYYVKNKMIIKLDKHIGTVERNQIK
jgi:hypothetical protein